ncbi:CoA-binding protein, partial [Streptomyces mirabilis]
MSGRLSAASPEQAPEDVPEHAPGQGRAGDREADAFVASPGYRVWALPGLPEVRQGDDLGKLIAVAEPGLADGDVLLVTSKIVSKAEGRLVEAADREAAIDAETVRVVARRGALRIVDVEHLVSAARADGVTTFTADALSENHEVLRLFTDLGLRVGRRFEGPEVRCTIALDEDDTYLAAVEARGRAADVASLEPLLRPDAVAVVGAGRRPGSVGRALLHHLHAGGFTRRLFAVNPHVSSVLGVPSYPSVSSLPKVPDLAVLAIPADALPATAEECGKVGVRALLVLTAGLDPDQAEALMTACRTHGMRLVGPNCLGISNTDPRLRLDATFAADHPRPGTAGVAVQSGGVGIALLDGLSRLGIGVSAFVSLGDKCDVSGNDMLQWWESDGRTDLALLHLESFGNPRAFSRTARRVTRRMPVLTVDAGRTEAGRRAAASHTAAAATRTMTRQALFTQAGITATRSVGELLETAALLHAQPLPAGTRVAIVTNAGGAGVLAADACAEAGLTLPAPTPELIDDLLAALPEGAAVGNPVDATAAVTEDQLRDCVDRLLRYPGIDTVLLALVPTAVAVAT